MSSKLRGRPTWPAEFFGKNHSDVVRRITGILGEPGEQGLSIFADTSSPNPQNGQLYRSFDMTRDGFVLLAMGFTEAKALQFKLAYIAAFNDMERRLVTAPVLPDFTNPALAARAWADEVEQKMEAQKQIEDMKPLA